MLHFRGLNVRLGVCLPKGGSFDVSSFGGFGGGGFGGFGGGGGGGFTQVSSLSALDSSTDSNHYYYDSNKGYVLERNSQTI